MTQDRAPRAASSAIQLHAASRFGTVAGTYGGSFFCGLWRASAALARVFSAYSFAMSHG
jgi:hypothetical protein